MSEIMIAHTACTNCGSSDALTVYDDHTFCFACEEYRHTEYNGEGKERRGKVLDIINNSDMEFRALSSRGITKATCQKMGYYVTKDDYGHTIQVANYCDEDGRVKFQKARSKDKKFHVRGKQDYIFFGQHLWPNGGTRVVITEGEIDALSYFQLNGLKYPTVSLPFGCKSAVETFKENYDWLCKFDEVVIMFDMDEHGQEAVHKVSGILPPHKLKIAKLPMKDANECLVSGCGDAVIAAMWNAEEFRPAGIVNAKDLKDDVFSDDNNIVCYSFPWNDDLNRMTCGLRKDELVLVTAGSGIGKSTIVREIAYKMNREDNLKIGMMMLEEKTVKTARDILSIHMQMPLSQKWNDEGVKELAKNTYDELYADGRFVFYDHFGSMESDDLINKMRYMIVAEGCDFIILDHISIVVSGMDSGNKSEVKVVDMLMTNLRSLVAETGVGIIVISHLRKTDGKSKAFEEGGKISMDDLRGSGALKQLSDTILAFERNQQAEDESKRDLIRSRVLKCRFTGETGPTETKLRFNKNTYRISEALGEEFEDEAGEESPF